MKGRLTYIIWPNTFTLRMRKLKPQEKGPCYKILFGLSDSLVTNPSWKLKERPHTIYHLHHHEFLALLLCHRVSSCMHAYMHLFTYIYWPSTWCLAWHQKLRLMWRVLLVPTSRVSLSRQNATDQENHTDTF